MKQKVVIKVTMNGQKSRSKALKVVVGVQGVESAALQGQEKIEVTGDIDAAELAMLLRKNVGHAELESVSAVGEKKEEKKEEKKIEASGQPMIWPSYPYVPQYMYEVNHEPSCSIM